MSNIKEFIKSNRQYFEDFISRSTYHSNAIEGNTLSLAETYAIIFNDNSLKISAQPREIYEAINHKYAIDYILGNCDNDLDEKFIINIAIQINKNINEIDGYRTSQVIIKGAEHMPPAPEALKQRMMYFVYNYNHTVFDSIYEKIASNHIEFERIHPFSDGNGRTGRLLMNYELIKNNLSPVVITKESRAFYLEKIETQDVQGLTAFIRDLSEAESSRMLNFKKATAQPVFTLDDLKLQPENDDEPQL